MEMDLAPTCKCYHSFFNCNPKLKMPCILDVIQMKRLDLKLRSTVQNLNANILAAHQLKSHCS